MRPTFASLARRTAMLAILLAAIQAGAAGDTKLAGRFSAPVAFDVLPSLSRVAPTAPSNAGDLREVRPDRGAVPPDSGFAGDAALQSAARSSASAALLAPVLTLQNFEGLSNQDNFNVHGFRVNPPDPVGAVGPAHYVEMINLVFAVYSKSGQRLLGPRSLGSIWQGFAVADCADDAGDPIVVYDQLADRWLLTQFTAKGPNYWNCVAVSQTGDPTGAYYRYAFASGVNFPDYPKYGVWTDSYVITTREFGPTVEYGIGVYALEKRRMLVGDPGARMVSYFLDGNDPTLLPLVGDGLLPASMDGKRRPLEGATIPIVGTQDDGAGYGAAFDAINVWELDIKWRSTPSSSLALATQLPVASFDSIFPCAPTARDCLWQPGVSNPNLKLDVLSYRQRPTFRLAYRNMGTHEALVTSQSVEALPGVAGMRWYELRRTGTQYSVAQQGTYAPTDGVHRWMGSVAMDKLGNIALGYSVVNATDVFPGIRFTGRLGGDAAGTMTVPEGIVINGSGVQTTSNSRWGDYTAMTVDPVDDCTFWYVNEYYSAAGQASSPAGWQTRIASFRLPGCQ